jgi:cyclopropane-fatty-acyl-phospholipid synthase
MIAKNELIEEKSDEAVAATSASWWDRRARAALFKRLEGLGGGRIVVREPGVQSAFGAARADDNREPLEAELTIRRPRFFRRAALGGSLGVAESYLAGDWDCDDLTALIRILLRDSTTGDRADGWLAPLWRAGARLLHRLRPNSRSGSRRNIAAHYDLGNEFFQLLLDDTLAYSSGIFVSPQADLRDASIEKMDRICRKLDLRPGDEVVEIGSGWGGWAIHAAANYGCRVTTTTISRRQYDLARRRIDEAGLADRITLLLEDYRDLRGTFDKLVSVEMIEAVGHRYFDDYFRACSRLLRPDGSMLVQAIVMPDRHYGPYLKSVDFIQRYVFPGGCLPSLGAIVDSTARATDLRMVHVEDFGPHYAETLRAWRSRFRDRLDEVRALGYDERFVRLWSYYMAYSEAAFEERYIGVVQVQFDKPRCRRDPISIGRRAAGAATTVEGTAS